MNGICLIWSRGRLISPSLPVGGDRYLNLSSQKRPTGRNLGGNRLVRRSGATSRGTVVLVFCSRMRRFPLNSCSYHIRGNEMNCIESSEYLTAFASVIRARFLSMRADQSSSWLIRTQNGPLCNNFALLYPLQKVQKCQYLAIVLNFVFLKNIGIYLSLIFFLHCSN